MRIRTRAVLLASGLLIGATGPAFAQSGAQSGGEATFGGEWWHQNAREARFWEFREVPLGGFLESFSLWRYGDKGRTLLTGTNALRHDQAYTLDAQFAERFQIQFGYRQTPHTFSWIARSPWAQTSPGHFVLPDSLQRTNQNNPAAFVATMTDVLNSSPIVPLEFRTDIATGRAHIDLAPEWSLDVGAMRRNRSGSKAYGMSFGFSSADELWVPIHQNIYDADATLEYRHSRVTVQGGMGTTVFRNHAGELAVDNPKRVTDVVGGDGAARGVLDLFPDNHSIRGHLGLAVTLPRRSAFDAHVTVATAEQNDAWLPFTSNSAISQSNPDSLPGTNTDASAVLYVQDYRLTSRPFARLSGTLRFHHEHYDNETPVYTFTGQVRTDATWSPGLQSNHPFGHSRAIAGVDVDYDVTKQLDVGATYEFAAREHTLREIEKDDEQVLSGRVRLRPRPDVLVRADYRHGDRQSDEFFVADYQNSAGTLIEQPGLRRFDVADRVQDLVRTSASWVATDRVTIGAAYDYLRNNYDASALGLQDEKRHLVGAHVLLQPRSAVYLRLGGGYERTSTLQKSRESGGSAVVLADTTSWTADIDVENPYAFAGVEWWARPDRVRIDVSYFFARDNSAYDLDNFKHTAQDLPESSHDVHEVSVEATYQLASNLDVAARYGYEHYDVTDFATENVPLLNVASGAANAIFLGDSALDYRAHRIAVVATRRF